MKSSIVLVLFPCFVWGFRLESQADNNFRICGGKDAVQGQFPYQISLRKGPGRQWCGGSILNSKWILTAAHCVHNELESKYYVHAGSILLDSGGTNHKIEKFVVHEEYGPDNDNKADLALIKLQDEIKFSDNYQPIELGTEYFGGEVTAVVSGWGRNSEGQIPNNQQYLEVKTITNEKCKEIWNEWFQHPEQICALTERGLGVCHADSGGPLVADGKQIGIVSWGAAGCAQGKPDVYVRVSDYVGWIKENIGN